MKGKAQRACTELHPATREGRKQGKLFPLTKYALEEGEMSHGT